MPTFHRTPHTLKSLTLQLSLAEGVESGDLQGKRYRITVPLNGLVFDNHATTPAWFYAVFPPQLGSGSVPVPAGIRLTGSQPVMSGADSADPRQAIVSRLSFDIEFTSDAAVFESLPLIVKGYAAATNAPASFSLPAFTPSPDAPFVVADADGGALATGIAVEELSVFASDSELLQGEDSDYYLDRANHTGTQAMGTVTGLGTALDELAEATLPPGDTTGQVLAKASETHYDAQWVDSSGGSGGTGVGNQRPIEQAGHGLAVGDWVRHDGTGYVKAQADSAGNAEVVGIVNAVDGTDAFTLASDGYVDGLSGLTAATVYFLSPDTAGETTASEPATTGQVSRPVFLAVSATAGYILNYRGYVVPEESGDSGGGNQVVAVSVGLTAPPTVDAGGLWVQWDLEHFDTHDFHDLSTHPSRLTVPAGQEGIYQIVAQATFGHDPTHTGLREMNVMHNGGLIAGAPQLVQALNATALALNKASLSATGLRYLAAGDYIELYVTQDSGDDLELYNGYSFLQMVKIGVLPS